MIVTDDAFDELLDYASYAEEAAEAKGGDVETVRRLFAVTVDRAMKKVVKQKDKQKDKPKDGRAWFTQTLRRYGCRLHFLRNDAGTYLVACLPLDDGEDSDTNEDHST